MSEFQKRRMREAFAAQEGVAAGVARGAVGPIVLAAVGFDDEFGVEAGEVDDEAADRGLAAEVIAERF